MHAYGVLLCSRAILLVIPNRSQEASTCLGTDRTYLILSMQLYATQLSDFLAYVVLQTPAMTISTEEETYSRLSYMVFYNNWKGIYSQLIPFMSQNSTLQASMGAQVQKIFGDAFACLPIQTKVCQPAQVRPSESTWALHLALAILAGLPRSFHHCCDKWSLLTMCHREE